MRSRRVDSCASSDHGHFAFSYEPVRGKEPEVVDAEDIVPTRGPHETDVWLTQCQVAEDGLDVALDQPIDWARCR